MALAAGLQGCAGVGTPPTQTLRVQTPGCAVASCELSNDLGRWQVARTPGSVAVSVSRQPLMASCRVGELAPATALASSFRPATSGGGAVTGGVVGGAATGAAFGSAGLAFIPPLGVIAVLGGVAAGAVAGNAAEGRSRPLRYSETVSIPMRCADVDGGLPDGGTAAPALGLGIRGLTVAEATAAGLGERMAAVVTAVLANSPADAAALRAGDLILAVNGQDVGDAADVQERVLALPPALPLALRVWRDRRIVELVLHRVQGPGTP